MSSLSNLSIGGAAPHHLLQKYLEGRLVHAAPSPKIRMAEGRSGCLLAGLAAHQLAAGSRIARLEHGYILYKKISSPDSCRRFEPYG